MGDLIAGPWQRCLDIDLEEEDRPRLQLIVTPRQSCNTCALATFGPRGTYCTEFGEWILDEAEAGEDCPTYELDDNA